MNPLYTTVTVEFNYPEGNNWVEFICILLYVFNALTNKYASCVQLAKNRDVLNHVPHQHLWRSRRAIIEEPLTELTQDSYWHILLASWLSPMTLSNPIWFSHRLYDWVRQGTQVRHTIIPLCQTFEPPTSCRKVQLANHCMGYNYLSIQITMAFESLGLIYCSMIQNDNFVI